MLKKIILTIFIFNSAITFSNNYNWELALSGRVLSTPIERESGDIILICEDRRVYSINITDGSINWKLRPGGKLEGLELSPDGSIIVYSSRDIYSIYGNGEIRWSKKLDTPIEGDISINSRGEILYLSSSTIYKIDRFGEKSKLISGRKISSFKTLNNSLIAIFNENKCLTLTYGNNVAWDVSIDNKISIAEVIEKFIFLISPNGDVFKFNESGDFIDKSVTENTNPYFSSFNFNEDLIFKGDLGTSLITNSNTLLSRDTDSRLYYSKGYSISADSSWILKCEFNDGYKVFSPSGKKQIEYNRISLSDKRVWNDSKLLNYYTKIVTNSSRIEQLRVLEDIKTSIYNENILELYPNFYTILLSLASNSNPLLDVRAEAYRIIGLSKDISFVPYLLNDLVNENSYNSVTYIYYALGQIGVDTSGIVTQGIVNTIGNFFDETLAVNGLYALYYINNYTNGEFLDTVFKGVEILLNSGYSKTLENRCYEVIKLLK